MDLSPVPANARAALVLTSGSKTVSGVWNSDATETPGHFPAEQEAGTQPWQEGLSGLDLWVSWDLSQFLPTSPP